MHPAEPTRLSLRDTSLAALVYALYTALLFAPLLEHLWTGAPARWLEGDVPEEYGPDLMHLCRALGAGEIPHWNPYEHAGRPFSADPQTGTYFPLHWALCAVSGAHPSMHVADFRVALFFFLGSLGVFVFSRREGLGALAAGAGGLLFPLTPFLRHNWELNLTWTFALTPWVLAALRDVARTPTWRRGLWLGVTVSSALLSGSPPAFFYLLCLAVPFGLFVLLTEYETPIRDKLAPFAVGAGFVALTCVPLLVQTAALLPLSTRADASYAAMSAGGITVSELRGVVWPFDGEHTFVSFGMLALASFGLWRSPSPARLLWLVLALAGLGLMLGDHAPFFRVFYSVVPGASLFRNPTRFSVLWGTGMLLLACHGLDALRSLPRARWWTVGLTVSMLAELLPFLPPDRHTRAGPFEARGAALYASLRARLDAEPSPLRVWDEFGLHFRSGSRYAFRELRGYQDPLSLGRYLKTADAVAEAPQLLPALSVRYVLRGPHYLHGDSHYTLRDPATLPFMHRLSPGLFAVDSALPLALIVPCAERVADADEALARWIRRAPRPYVALEGAGDARCGDSPVRPVRLALTDATLSADVRGQSGWLVIHEAHHPGWTAVLDGAPAPVLRANGFVRAVRIPRGSSTLRMTFVARGAASAEPLAACAWLGALAVGLSAIPRRRPRRSRS